MNKNIPDIENITDAVSDEYRKTKRLCSDLKKSRFRSTCSVKFTLPGGRTRKFRGSMDMPMEKAVLIAFVIAVSLIALIVFHIKKICGK